ncbi:MAG: DUF3459 domain-containing protein [Acetobacteraceae bacterium]|nr:DUF3459 domain-containing protein [Acetobacteraceae bacterium]
MRWDASRKAGFTTGEPWLPIGDDVARCNIRSQRKDPRSMLNLYRRLINLRRETPALRFGSFEPMREQGEVLLFARRLAGQKVIAIKNLSPGPQIVSLTNEARIMLSTALDRQEQLIGPTVWLRPDEGLLVQVS